MKCPQHITPRYDKTMIAKADDKLRTRVAELEAQNARLLRAVG